MDMLRARRFQIAFVRSAQCVLLITGFAKMYSSFGTEDILHVHDPVFPMTNATLMRATGLAEILGAFLIFFLPTLWLRYLVILWYSFGFLSYRIAAWLADSEKPCPCLGTLTDKWPISPKSVDLLLAGILLYFLLGSLTCLLLSPKSDDPSIADAPRKAKPC